MRTVGETRRQPVAVLLRRVGDATARCLAYDRRPFGGSNRGKSPHRHAFPVCFRPFMAACLGIQLGGR